MSGVSIFVKDRWYLEPVCSCRVCVSDIPETVDFISNTNKSDNWSSSLSKFTSKSTYDRVYWEQLWAGISIISIAV